MRSIILTASKHIPGVCEKLNFYLRDFRHKDFVFQVKEREWGKFYAYECMVQNNDQGESQEEAEKRLRSYIAKVAADVIINDIEKSILKNKIDREYTYFSEEERHIIHQNAVNFLQRGMIGSEIIPTSGLRRENEVFQRVLEYINDNDHLCLEGFITFRMQDYLKVLEGVIEKAADEYIVEREYKEFIQLLKYFVELQEPRLEEVHIIIRRAGVFQLEDAAAQPIKEDYLQDFSLGLINDFIEYEDVLISALIAISPIRLILHLGSLKEYQEVVDILRNVFGERLEICRSCSRCCAQENPSLYREQ